MTSTGNLHHSSRLSSPLIHHHPPFGTQPILQGELLDDSLLPNSPIRDIVITERDAQLLAELHRASVMAIPRSIASCHATAWAETQHLCCSHSDFFVQRKSPFSFLFAHFAHLQLSHNTFEPSRAQKKRKVPESGLNCFFCHSPQSAHHNHPHNSCVQVSTFLCALWTEHHRGTAGVQGSLFLFSVRVCDLLEWMPSAPLHTCPDLHASTRLVCRWANVLGGHSVFSFRLKPRFVRGFLSYKPVSPCSW